MSASAAAGGGGGGGAFDSPSGTRTWGTTKDRGKIRLDQSHRLFCSLDVTASNISPPVQVNRLTDSPSPPLIAPTPRRWSDNNTYSSLPYSNLWSTTFEDDEASLSCDSLDFPSTTHQTLMTNSNVTSNVSSPSPPLCPTPRKRWSCPSPNLDPLIDTPLDEVVMTEQSQHQPQQLQQQQQQQRDEEELHPRFVCWELPFTSNRSSNGPAKPLVRVQPRMRSEVNPPAAHRCDLKALRRPKPRSRPSSRERANQQSGSGKSEPDSLLDVSSRSSVKSKWTRRVGVQQLLPSKACISSSALDVRANAQSGQGTRSHPNLLHEATVKCKLEMDHVQNDVQSYEWQGMKGGLALEWNMCSSNFISINRYLFLFFFWLIPSFYISIFHVN